MIINKNQFCSADRVRETFQVISSSTTKYGLNPSTVMIDSLFLPNNKNSQPWKT